MTKGKDNPEHHQFIFYTPQTNQEEIKQNWNKHLFQITIKNNADIITNIDEFITKSHIDGYIKNNYSKPQVVKEKLIELLTNVQTNLQIINDALTIQSSDTEMLKLKNNIINRHTKSFQAYSVILTPTDKKGRRLPYKLNSTLKRLLPTPMDDYKKYVMDDYKKQVSEYDIIYNTVNESGGTKKQIREYLQIVDRQGQIGGDINFDDSTLDLEELKYSFYSYLYNYFDYVGAAVYEKEFLISLFKEFYSDKSILPTLDEFQTIYDKKYKNMLSKYLTEYNKNVSETENVSEEVSLLEQSNIFLDKLDLVIKSQKYQKRKTIEKNTVSSKKSSRLFQDPITLLSGPASNSQELPAYEKDIVKPMDIDGDVNMNKMDIGKTPPEERIPIATGPAGIYGGNKLTKRFGQRHKYKKSKKINKKQNKKTRKVKNNLRKGKKNTRKFKKYP